MIVIYGKSCHYRYNDLSFHYKYKYLEFFTLIISIFLCSFSLFTTSKETIMNKTLISFYRCLENDLF